MRRETIAVLTLLLLLAGRAAHADEGAASGDDEFDALMAPAGSDDEDGSDADERDGALDFTGASVRVPLSVFERLATALRAATASTPPRGLAPAVLLGEADYQGRVIEDGPERTLAFTLRLGVTLGGGDTWTVI